MTGNDNGGLGASERGEWVKVDMDELAAAGLEVVWFADVEIKVHDQGGTEEQE